MRPPLDRPDGTRLHRQAWLRPGARGTVLIVHGLGEHSGRYAHVAEALNAVGWDVAAYDHRGHGRSGGARGTLPSDTALLEDLAAVLDAERAAGHGSRQGKLVLMGHSMGGAIAARFVAEGTQAAPAAWHRKVDALVLSSPALAAHLGPFDRLLLAVMPALAPNLAVANGLKPAWVSRDAKTVADYTADPLNHDRITPRLGRFIIDAGAFARDAAPRWTVPTLLMWAGADRCVAPRGSADFAAAAPRGMVAAREWPGLFHEIFNEPERGQVLDALQGWIATH
jgi:alpha-beta hydrolase superfamily lysophospholipase